MSSHPIPNILIFALLLAPPYVAAEEPTPLATGPWHGWITSRGGHIAFDMLVESSSNGLSVTITNGDETVPVQEIDWDGNEVVFRFLDYDAFVRARINDGGRKLDGKWGRRFGSASTPLPLHAVAGDLPRFQVDDPAQDIEGTVAGRWLVNIDHYEHPTVGVFETHEDGTAGGTILTTFGDKRWLYGVYRGGRLILSRFDGFHAFLLDVTLQPDGTLQGQFGEAGIYVSDLHATRDPDAQLPDPVGLFDVSGPVDVTDPQFLDLEKRPCSLAGVADGADVILVEITGTWCPNCHDATKFLLPFYEEYRDRGLAVIALAFEMSTDVDRNIRFLRRYREKYRVPYPMLLAFGGAARGPSQVFPTIRGEYSFPTIILLDGEGNVLGVHTGFTGPASPDDYAALQRDFRSRLVELLGEPESGR